MSSKEDSACSRCPPEIWAEIMRLVTLGARPTPENNPHSVDLRWSPFEHRVRHVTCQTTILRLALVCRSWNAIVTPWLFEWIALYVHHPISSLPFVLRQHIGSRTKGTIVKRLAFYFNDNPYYDEYGTPWELDEEKMRDVVGIINACPLLEDFFCAIDLFARPDVAQSLLSTSAQTLRFVWVSEGEWHPFTFYADVLRNCPRLEALRCQAGCEGADEDEQRDRMVAMHHASFPSATAAPLLRVFTFNLLHADDSEFLDAICTLNLPKLRQVRIRNEHMPPTPDSVLPHYVNFLARFGSQLTSVYLSNYTPDLVPAVLRHCPNLEEFVICVSYTEPLSVMDELIKALRMRHPRLRYVGCNYIVFTWKFKSFREEIHNPAMLERVREMVEVLSSFPSLKTIRFLTEKSHNKIECIDFSSSWASAKSQDGFDRFYDDVPLHEALCRYYRGRNEWLASRDTPEARMEFAISGIGELTRQLYHLCDSRGIRLEDAQGDLIGYRPTDCFA